MEHHDVVIVGAGPAGLAAAKECSNAGVDTLLIEKDDILQPKKNWEASTLYLKDFGLDGAIVREHKVDRWVCGFGKNVSTYDMQIKGNIKRCVVDQTKLTRIMIEQGNFKIEDHTTVKSVDRTNGEVKIRTKNKEGDEDIFTKIIIDATGWSANIARTLGKNTPCEWGWVSYGGHMQDADLSMLGIDENVCLHVMCKAPTQFGPSSCEISIYPRDSSTVDMCFTFHLLKRDIKEISPYSHLDDEKAYCKSLLSEVMPYLNETHLNNFFDQNKIHKEYYGFGKESKVREPYADNFLMVGDSAGLAPPLYSYGLESSLVSGRLGGKIAANAILAGNATSTYLRGYENLLEKEWLRGIWRKIIREITIGGFIVVDDEEIFNVLLMTLSKIYEKEGSDTYCNLLQLHNISSIQTIKYALALLRSYLVWGENYFRRSGLKKEYLDNMRRYLERRL